MRPTLLVFALLWPASLAAGGTSLRPLFDAMRQVETGSHPNGGFYAVGDEGRSIGPYQIQYRYWRDSGIGGRYEDVRYAAVAERVMIRYWRRYCPRALTSGNWEVLARIHNGGPFGYTSAQTAAYWQKVRRELQKRR